MTTFKQYLKELYTNRKIVFGSNEPDYNNGKFQVNQISPGIYDLIMYSSVKGDVFKFSASVQDVYLKNLFNDSAYIEILTEIHTELAKTGLNKKQIGEFLIQTVDIAFAINDETEETGNTNVSGSYIIILVDKVFEELLKKLGKNKPTIILNEPTTKGRLRIYKRLFKKSENLMKSYNVFGYFSEQKKKDDNYNYVEREFDWEIYDGVLSEYVKGVRGSNNS